MDDNSPDRLVETNLPRSQDAGLCLNAVRLLIIKDARCLEEALVIS